MKRLSILLILTLLVCGFCAAAENGYPPYDYLVSKGYTPEWLDDSPGRRTCNLIVGNGWLGLNFSDETNSWTLMALPMFNPTFKSSVFEELFVEMVENFDWDVSFYWPDYDSGANIAASYNIVEDIDKTDANYTDKFEYTKALRRRFNLPTAGNPVASTPAAANSRRNPATIGQPVKIKASRRGLDYTMSVSVDEFYRGADYVDFIGDNYKTGSSGCEYVAAKVTVTFESIDYIQPAIVGTDDPEMAVGAILNFKSYSSTGAKYDNVHYSVYGMKELTNLYEGASTTGYFQFEISEDDPAPMLIYEPEYEQRVFISLQ